MLAPKLQDLVAVDQFLRGAIANIAIGEVTLVVAATRGGTAVVEYVQRRREEHVAGRPGLNMLLQNAASQKVRVIRGQPADKIQIDHVHGHVPAPKLQVVSHLVLDILANDRPDLHAARSEERRVGKECRSRWSP